MTNIIQINGLSKFFGKTKAVDNVTYNVKKGEIFGLLGPNGAGKSTIISMLSTVLLPTSGTATVCGFDLLKDPGEVRKNIGVVFQESVIDDDLSAYDNLDIHARLYKLPKRKNRISELLDLMDLKDVGQKRVSTYSGGMKRKVEVARGLLNGPKVLFLDEPTSGFDPQTKRALWDYIVKINQKGGVSILLTTQNMEEADKLCDRVCIISYGKVVAIDTPKKLKSSLKATEKFQHEPSLEDVFLNHTMKESK